MTAPNKTSERNTSVNPVPVVAPKTIVWIWRDVEVSGAVRDLSEMPQTSEAHEACTSLWWWCRRARLCPAKVVSAKGRHIIVAPQEKESKELIEVPATQLLPWYEGLLLLDAIARSSNKAKVPWFKDLVGTLERARTKHQGQISSAKYVEKKLLEVAITGPKFINSAGEAFAHRRQRMRKIPPSDLGHTEGYFKVEALAEYLPPWDALLHPKCGFYQDYYMVRWGPPYNEVDYTDFENGSDALCGATWEPDECLPDDLDTLRLSAKRSWLQEQMAREEKQLAEDNRPLYKQGNIELFDDIIQPHIRNGEAYKLDMQNASLISHGWPRALEDFPQGYAPAMPPGCCERTCDCMEDWHFGAEFTTLLGPKPWLEDEFRSNASKRALDGFQAELRMVRTRGQVTGKWHLEPNSEEYRRENAADEAVARGFSVLVLSVMREAAQAIPLSAFRSNNGCGILSALVTACAEDTGAVYTPTTFKLISGPAWLRVDAVTGDMVLVGEELPATFAAGEGVSFIVHLGNFCSGGPLPSDQITFRVDPHAEENGGPAIAALTVSIAERAQSLRPQSLRDAVQERLRTVYDFDPAHRGCLDATFGVWARSMAEAASAARTASLCHVVQRTPALSLSPSPPSSGALSPSPS